MNTGLNVSDLVNMSMAMSMSMCVQVFVYVSVCAGAVFPTGDIGGRLGRHSEAGAKNCAQQKKKQEL